MYLGFLQHSTRVLQERLIVLETALLESSTRAIPDFQLSPDSRHIYRKAETKIKKGKPITYLPFCPSHEEYAFHVIANVRSLYHHTGIRKMWDNVCDNFYEVTDANVKFVLEACTIC